MTTVAAESTKPASLTVASLIDLPRYKARFQEVLGDRTPQFLSSLISAVQSSSLRTVEPKSVLAAAMVAATLDLPIEKNLGYAYIVPYKGRAQFQMGYKGYIQLAQRTGQYSCINDVVIPAGVLTQFDPIKGELILDWDKSDTTQPPAGYVCYFRLLSGFEKTVFWTRHQVEHHAKRYAQGYHQADSPWQRNFDSMALKTVIKAALSKYGILSVQLCTAMQNDQGGQEEPLEPDNSLVPNFSGQSMEADILDFTPGSEAVSNPPPADRLLPAMDVLRQTMSIDSITDAEFLAVLKSHKKVPVTCEKLEELSEETLLGLIKIFNKLRQLVLSARQKSEGGQAA